MVRVGGVFTLLKPPVKAHDVPTSSVTAEPPIISNVPPFISMVALSAMRLLELAIQLKKALLWSLR